MMGAPYKGLIELIEALTKRTKAPMQIVESPYMDDKELPIVHQRGIHGAIKARRNAKEWRSMEKDGGTREGATHNDTNTKESLYGAIAIPKRGHVGCKQVL